MPYGIYDTKDKCWLGNSKGPLQYRTRILNGKVFSGAMQARVAMTVINEQFQSSCRFRKGRLPAGIDTLKDEITPPVTFLKALKAIEARKA